MKAVTNAYGPGESAVLAALAGASTILFSHTRAYQEAAHDALVDAARSGRLPEEMIARAVSEVTAMKERFATSTPPPALDRIRHPDHLAITARAARAGVVAMPGEGDWAPLDAARGQAVGLVEFASALDSEALESGGHTGLATLFAASLPALRSVALDPSSASAEGLAQAHRLAAESDVLIVATRNAHLYPAQRDAAQALIGAGRRVILLCLRNPYDAGVLSGMAATLFTCGDSAPSLQAAVDALLGRFVPAGRLPVPLVMPA